MSQVFLLTEITRVITGVIVLSGGMMTGKSTLARRYVELYGGDVFEDTPIEREWNFRTKGVLLNPSSKKRWPVMACICLRRGKKYGLTSVNIRKDGVVCIEMINGHEAGSADKMLDVIRASVIA